MNLLRCVTLSFALVCTTLVGCGGDDKFNKGEACDRAGGALCDRVVGCGLIEKRSECISVFKKACCEEDKSCGEEAEDEDAAEAEVNACVAAFKAQSCEDVEAEEVPDACE